MGGKQSKPTNADSSLTVEERRELEYLRTELEDRLKLGLKPVVTPALKEREAKKALYEYEDGKYHIAVTGMSGTGKSSFINAVRGLGNRSNNPLVAATGVAETTLKPRRYPDPDNTRPYVWYDIPGAGTLEFSDWQYFNDHGLYIFDCIVVLFDTRFFETDVAILKHCVHFGIPSFIVRSKSEVHVQNIYNELLEFLIEEDDIDEEQLRMDARVEYIGETRESVAHNLGRAGLSRQPISCIDRTNLLRIVQGKRAPDAIDEAKLLRTMLTVAQKKLRASSDHPAPPYST